MISALTARRVSVDTNVFIYLLEGVEGLEEVSQTFRRIIVERAFEAFTSEFTLCEVLVHPLRRAADEEVAAYRSLIEISGAFTTIPVDLPAFVEAARLRATLGLRTPDAIHVACALHSGCDVILSNDQRLQLHSHLIRVEFR
ncbi:type II toxin-antitoxin system VapC family toxin [Aureimonas pseudogalii]|uniref:Ribonuclease VapC n=1 Tax=Aureimonas pseudogalii TaxID=1744844 RepID=A0A7W6MLK7_9HYPH|nr:type II toxin-antitoxin system VapC family toxin [Aureimonas pseudogalii]MBB3999854.1 putative nucleic acid-binding protein [Aureimonas pseudogalii]